MFKPVVTPVALVVTAVPSLLQFALPWLEPALRRDPAAIRAGEWWRLITALVVQDGGPYGTLTNLAFLAVLGYVAERAIGPGRWLVLYASGAVAGELSGLLYGQAGAGNSIALCGLAGGLAVLTWRGQTDDRLGAALGAFYAALMAIPAGVTAGGGSLGVAGLVVIVVVAALAFQLVLQRGRLPRWVFPAVTGVAGAGLSVMSDLHGPALLAGMIAGWILIAVSRSTSTPTSSA
ncbi:rhomboid family intramembrane serine protease [Nonomuraea sp. NBC_01738]|uniref:rhomboid family intramembrane serine protease n=1 Tax=Nonomuraea sp. NBC_01738 TaxID=2976003 RepID=UPI002E152337|nr:rhomboid family intramembrane serine protease [Nonomuraea sp. NBC_01738]